MTHVVEYGYVALGVLTEEISVDCVAEFTALPDDVT